MGRITTKPDQASGRGRRSGRSGCRENPAAVTDPQRQAGRLQAVADPRRELEVFRPDQKGQATARIPQLSRIHAAGKTASGSGRRSDRADRLLFISTTYQLPLFSPLD